MKTQINEQTQWQTQWQTQSANNIHVRIVARKKRILDDDVVITQDKTIIIPKRNDNFVLCTDFA